MTILGAAYGVIPHDDGGYDFEVRDRACRWWAIVALTPLVLRA